jgi:formylglycine-generating enzyme required for sulfatase activity
VSLRGLVVPLALFAASANDAFAWRTGDVFRDCADCPEMVVIPAGEFVMGSPPDEPGRKDHEGPQQRVHVDAVAVGRFEVTWAQWQACMRAGGCGGDASPAQGRGDDHPVVRVNWDDAQAYVQWLARATGAPYRLLTEAEWEYAARASTTGVRWWGASDAATCDFANVADPQMQARYADQVKWPVFDCDDGAVETAPVGRYAPNPWGLHDLFGNVMEWVEDCYAERRAAPTNDASGGNGASAADAAGRASSGCERRVARGGSWVSGPRSVRAASREWATPRVRSGSVGLRVARGLPGV